MTSLLLDWIDLWQSLPILVIGDIMLDSYLTGTSNRLCPEAPAPVVAVQQCQEFAGGAANTAMNLHHLGGSVTLLSVMGTDAAGDRLHHILQQQGLATTRLICHPERETLTKQRILVHAQLLMRLDQGSTQPIDLTLEQRLIDRLIEQFPRHAAVVVSDYGYGILTPRVIQTLAQLQASQPRLLMIDAKQLHLYQACRPTAVKPNYQQAIELLHLSAQINHRIAQILPHQQQLFDRTGATIVVVTFDREGAIVFESGQYYQTPAHPARSEHTSGAGDTYISALTLALTAAATPATAAKLAAAATAIVVQQPGTTYCTADQLRHELSTSHLINDRSSELSML